MKKTKNKNRDAGRNGPVIMSVKSVLGPEVGVGGKLMLKLRDFAKKCASFDAFRSTIMSKSVNLLLELHMRF